MQHLAWNQSNHHIFDQINKQIIMGGGKVSNDTKRLPTTHSSNWPSTTTPSMTMGSAQNRHSPPHYTGGFRTTLTFFILAICSLYILYSFLFLSRDSCPTTTTTTVLYPPTNSSFSSSSSSSSSQDFDPQDYLNDGRKLVPIRGPFRYDTELKHVVFGIAASSNLWDKRKEYIKTWWRPKETRGVVWLDKKVRIRRDEELLEIRISRDTSKFKYTNRQGRRSALRMSRVVAETLRLGMKDVRWFVMGDDNTVFVVDNLVRVLSKYDHNQFYYVGSSTESHVQNIYLSYGMAYGGGEFAISYPLAKELEKMQDKCIQRYLGLYEHAGLHELGVPLTREAGFHQYDVYGDVLGLLGAHSVTPLLSLHHIENNAPDTDMDDQKEQSYSNNSGHKADLVHSFSVT